MAETKKTVQSTAVRIYEYTAAAVPKETVRHQASCEETYIPHHLQQLNNELMKFIRAKRVNSTVLLYVHTSTPPQ